MPLFVSVPEAQRDRLACHRGSGCCEGQLVLFGEQEGFGGVPRCRVGCGVAVPIPAVMQSPGRSPWPGHVCCPSSVPEAATKRFCSFQEGKGDLGASEAAALGVPTRGSPWDRARGCCGAAVLCSRGLGTVLLHPRAPIFLLQPFCLCSVLGDLALGDRAGCGDSWRGLGTCPPCGTTPYGAADAFPQGTRAVCRHGVEFFSLAG